MAKVLTVDDSRAVRMIVKKQMTELGFEVEEAVNGEEGLARLEAESFDLVLLDVTMPVLDGPGMLEKMRGGGDKTPVLMLTSESKRSIVATLVKLGVEGYILKPFKTEELRSKVLRALHKSEDDVIATAGAGSPMPHNDASSGARQFIDVLVIDDMENVQKKLRGMIPQHITLNGCVSASAALAQCRERVYRLILIDIDLPDVNSATLMRQLRVLQPNAAYLAMALRSTNDVSKEARDQGFDDVLFKPFTSESIEDLMLQYFDTQELVSREDNVVTFGVFKGKDDKVDRYYSRIVNLVQAEVSKIAEACFDEMVVDASALPENRTKNAQLLRTLVENVSKLGMDLRIVGSASMRAVLKEFSETASIPFFATLDEAKAA
jgi:DNA-binding response OmpR family regulator